jgi:Skp family chaperone for outer membrane proteins
MNYWPTLVAGIIVALGAVFVSGASVRTKDEKPVDEKTANSAKPPTLTRPTSAVFNMAIVMRDFNQAKYQVWLLNKKKDELAKNLVIWRSEYTKIQTELRERPDHPKKEQKQEQMIELYRQIDDEDRKISKQLNEQASAIISDLYDKMKAVVDKTAKLNGYHLVFAYPDVGTPEELKLKPPAAQPFYVDPRADITALVVKTLNVWYPPIDPATGKRVDVSKLYLPSDTVPLLETPAPSPGTGSSEIELPPGMIPMSHGFGSLRIKLPPGAIPKDWGHPQPGP